MKSDPSPRKIASQISPLMKKKRNPATPNRFSHIFALLAIKRINNQPMDLFGYER